MSGVSHHTRFEPYAQTVLGSPRAGLVSHPHTDVRQSELALIEHALLAYRIPPTRIVLANSNAAAGILACGRTPCTTERRSCGSRLHYAFWNSYLWWSL